MGERNGFLGALYPQDRDKDRSHEEVSAADSYQGNTPIFLIFLMNLIEVMPKATITIIFIKLSWNLNEFVVKINHRHKLYSCPIHLLFPPRNFNTIKIKNI